MKKLLLTTLALVLLPGVVLAGELVNVAGSSNVALGGFDTVAFFTDSKAVNGSPFISADHKGATYFFSTEDHKKLFTDSPEKYLPQFGGYCAFGVSINKLFPVDISTWQIVDGKLYLNLNPDVRTKFDADKKANIAKAEQNWPGLVKKNAK